MSNVSALLTMHDFESAQFGVFLAAALVLAVTPGPGLAYVVARTAAGGAREGVASALGTALGGLGHVVAAALGLSAVIAQSAAAFTVVKYVGACYLVYLGLRILFTPQPRPTSVAVRALGQSRAFCEAALVELLNVKTALFFLAFIPQFVDGHSSQASQFVFLGAICVALNTTADLLAVVGVSRLTHTSAASALRAKILGVGSGVTLIFLGGYVALSGRPR
jgi:threonine/homoserine/homoserine lactone efflux protein